MYSQCPACNAVFRLSATELASAGLVHCGECGITFNPLKVLQHTLPDELLTTLPQVTPCEAPSVYHSAPTQVEETLEEIDLITDLATDLLQDEPEEEPNDEPATEEEESEWQHFVSDDEISSESEDPFIPDRLIRPLSDESRRTARGGTGWALGSVLLLLILMLQSVFLGRHQLAGSSLFRPIIDRACRTMGCTPPGPRALDEIRLVNRDIRPHPSVQGALIISATMVNNADFAQPFPKVEITLSDLNGTLVALRRFEPEDYLQGDQDEFQLMNPDALVPLIFEAVDPGQNAVAFEFGFL